MEERLGSQARLRFPENDPPAPLQSAFYGKLAQERKVPQQRQSLSPRLQLALVPQSEADLALGLQFPKAAAEEGEVTHQSVHPRT